MPPPLFPLALSFAVDDLRDNTILLPKIIFPSITISAQNCLSLNVSTKNNKTDLKILALTKNNSDIVLLSDI